MYSDIVLQRGPSLFISRPSLILHRGNGGDCVCCTLPLPWCPWNAPVEIYNFLIGCPCQRENALVPLPWCPWNAPVEIYNFLIGCPCQRENALVPLPFQKRSIQPCISVMASLLPLSIKSDGAMRPIENPEIGKDPGKSHAYFQLFTWPMVLRHSSNCLTFQPLAKSFSRAKNFNSYLWN